MDRSRLSLSRKRAAASARTQSLQAADTQIIGKGLSGAILLVMDYHE